MIGNGAYSIITAVAAKYVPDRTHKLLHINAYDTWVHLMTRMVEQGSIVPETFTLKKLARNWEALLIKRYSLLN